MGVMPIAFAFSSLISSTAAAPSVSGDEFPAVTVPYRRSNTGFSSRSFSMVVSSRMPLSADSGSNFGGAQTGIISAASRPSVVPACARRCERNANWS